MLLPVMESTREIEIVTVGGPAGKDLIFYPPYHPVPGCTGYTLGVASMSFTADPPFMAGKMPFDPEKDLAPITLIARVPLVFVINPAVPARSCWKAYRLS